MLFRSHETELGGAILYNVKIKHLPRERRYGIYTSSTGMELEALQQAISHLSLLDLDAETVIVATGWMAVPTRIRSGFLPSNLPSFLQQHHGCRVIWFYVPGHFWSSSQLVNERAYSLVASAEELTPLQLHSADVSLIAAYNAKAHTKELMANHFEGQRLRDEDVPFGHAASNHRRGLFK